MIIQQFKRILYLTVTAPQDARSLVLASGVHIIAVTLHLRGRVHSFKFGPMPRPSRLPLIHGAKHA